MDHLPVFLRLRAEPTVVVGGGRVAQRKIELLLKFGAHVTVIAPALCEELAARAARGEIRHVAEAFRPPHLDGARLAIAATDRRIVNTAVSEASRARALPVNVVDDPALSTFIFPAIIDRSPIVVAVGSAGNSPVLTRRVREQIEALLPGTLGALARFIGERRRTVQEALLPSARRSFWERIVAGKVGSRVLRGDTGGAQRDFERELRASQLTTSGATGTRDLGEVYLIGAGPGDPDLLTLRALQLLQQADVVLYDRLVPEAVLERCRRDARRIFVGKGAPHGPRGPHTDQGRIHELMLHFAREGLKVARLKGGDPFVFGRGGEEIEALARHGIPYVVVPGITAALGAASASGIPLTHRKLAQSFTVVTGHPLEDAALDWPALARPHQTVVFYMGVAHLAHIVHRLTAAGAPPTLPAALIERATLPGQRTLRGTLATIAALGHEAGISPPALLLVGEVAALNVDTPAEVCGGSGEQAASALETGEEAAGDLA
jgi:uroporphyrin-III C-methyltransferase/precorrin-2 dehydrogenase/sirohydrochlorin ferrochelatase